MEVGFLSEIRITFMRVDWWNNFNPIVISNLFFVHVSTAQVEGEFEFLGVRSIDNLQSHPHGVRRVVPNHCINAAFCVFVVVQRDSVRNSRWVDFRDLFRQVYRFIVQSEFNIMFGVLFVFPLWHDLELNLKLELLWFRNRLGSNILFVLSFIRFRAVWIEIVLTFTGDLAIDRVLSCDHQILDVQWMFKYQARTWPIWSGSDCDVYWLGIRRHCVEKGSVYKGVLTFLFDHWWPLPFRQ